MSSKKIIRVFSTLGFAWLIAILFFTSAFAQDSSQLVINYVESDPVEGEFEYDVSVFFNLLDATGNTIKDLQAEEISISEDGKNISISTLDLVTDDPIYISLLLDTSGSMSGTKNEKLIEASIGFVNGLQEKDQLAVTTFNSEIKSLIDFSTDHTAAANLISSVKAISKSGTCLYDAAYEAVQKTAALPMGRRAVIILTDGKDELLEGGPCSKLNIEDVINIATEGNIRVPIYTIGIGDSTDEASLTRISKLTGGLHSNAPDATKLGVLLNQLLDQLQTQYVLNYTSTAAPGSHTVVMNVKHQNSSYTDSHGFILPELALNIAIVSPVAGQQITDKITITTTLTGQGDPIKQVEFTVDDTIIGNDDTPPYELDWQPDSAMNGEHTVYVKVIGMDDEELASDSVTVTIAIPETVETSEPEIAEPTGYDWKKYLPYAGIILALLVGAGLFLFLKSRKKRELEKQRDAQWNQMVVNPPPLKDDSSNELTMDGFSLNPDALGVLTVMQSDDPAMIGKRFEIFDNAVRLGRTEDNEIRFAKDAPVSRRHAIIENQNGQLVISEMVAPVGDGTVKSPTFGTFVNDGQVFRPTVLQNGDLIRLGKRVVMRFESSRPELENDARTIDQFDSGDNEKTIDSY